MDEVEAIKAVASALDKLGQDAQTRVLAWAESRFGSSAPAPPSNNNHSTPASQSAPSSEAVATPKPSKAKGAKKTKSIISMDKSLNLSPSGKTSAVDFAKVKSPSNVKEKCVVAVYYLRETIGMDAVTVQAVFTFFKTLQWPSPSDMKNTLQQAGTEGWLDTANSDDIKITSIGENLVEHHLPKKPKE